MNGSLARVRSGERRLSSGVRPSRFARRTALLATAIPIALASMLVDGSPDGDQQYLLILWNSAVVLLGTTLRNRGDRRAVNALDLFLAIAYLHGCLIPSLDLSLGPASIPYRAVATDGGATTAAVFSAAFSTAVVVGWVLNNSHRRRRLSPSATDDTQLPMRGAWVLIAAGIVGLYLRVPHSLTGIASAEWLSGPDVSGAIGLVATWTAPLLPVGTFFFALGRRRSPYAIVTLGVLVALSILAMLSFSLNRAVILVPLFAMLLTFERFRGSRGTGWKFAAVSVAGLLLFIYIGQVRTALIYERLGLDSPSRDSMGTYLRETTEVYFQSPYLIGTVYVGSPTSPYGIESLTASVLGPVPIVGGGYRADSGTAIYNRMLYGNSTVDQILPTWLEFERSFGLGGLLAFGVVAGSCLRWLDERNQSQRDPLRYYVGIFGALWLAQAPIVSFLVWSQIAIYFVLPLVIASRTSSRSGNIPPGSTMRRGGL